MAPALDIVMPAHAKDFDLLPRAVATALRYVTPVRRVLIVSQDEFASSDSRVTWVPEPPSEVFPTLADIRERMRVNGQLAGGARPAHIYQELLKLGAGDYIRDLSSPYLVVDADVMFLRPVSFAVEPGTRFLYSLAREDWEPYRQAYVQLLGALPAFTTSVIAHHMHFDIELLAEMKGEIESRHGGRWFEAFTDAGGSDYVAGISEYCVYGWWVIDRYPSLSRHHQLRWLDVHRPPGLLARALLRSRFDFTAAHAYMRLTRKQQLRSMPARAVARLRTVVSLTVRRLLGIGR
jgi:hypothetical protein